jgi:hypothetical protein
LTWHMSSSTVTLHEATPTTGAFPPMISGPPSTVPSPPTSSLPSTDAAIRAAWNRANRLYAHDQMWSQSIVTQSNHLQSLQNQSYVNKLAAQQLGQVPVWPPHSPRPDRLPCKGNLMAEKTLISCTFIFVLTLLVLFGCLAAALWGEPTFWLRVGATALVFMIPAGIAAAIARVNLA